ncbi:MAG: M28 family peptidase [Rhodothermales bacterium]
MHEKASPERLRQHVDKIAGAFVPRDYTHRDNLRLTTEYVHDHFTETEAFAVSYQPFYAESSTYKNVTALLGSETEPRVVVGAHYDAAGPYPAADDNASGVAGLLELASLLADNPPDGAVEFVAYCLEEPPFFFSKQMGSYVHAAALREEGIDVSAMISLEMIGYFSDEPDSQRFPLFFLKPFYPSEGNFIAVVGRLFDRRLVRTVRDAMRDGSSLPVESLNAPSVLPGVAFSDHLSYWRNRYPALMITDTAMFRNPHYHGPGDRPETLDYGRMAMVVDGVVAAVRALAEH